MAHAIIELRTYEHHVFRIGHFNAAENERFYQKIVFTVETHFSLKGYVSTKEKKNAAFGAKTISSF